jgi:hypothetical protein
MVFHLDLFLRDLINSLLMERGLLADWEQCIDVSCKSLCCVSNMISKQRCIIYYCTYSDLKANTN